MGMQEHASQVFDWGREVVGRIREIDVEAGISRRLDSQYLALAHEAGRQASGGFFEVVSEAYTFQEPRPDAINHLLTYLEPNVTSTAEQDGVLALLDMLHGDQVPTITDIFTRFTTEHGLFERVQNGEKFIITSNHLELQDLGFTLGYLHKAARLQKVDRLEHVASVVIGRFLGYHQLLGMSVIDDILRKAASVIKSFPVSGGEALHEAQLSENELDLLMRAFRRHYNHQTNEVIEGLMTRPGGRILLQAGGGAAEYPDENGVVQMNPLGEGTRRTLIHACKAGAHVVPLFVDYGTDHSLIEFGEPVQVRTDDEAHEIGTTIAEMGNQQRKVAQGTHPHIDRFTQPIVYRPAA